MKLNCLGLLSMLAISAAAPSGASAETLESAQAFLESIYDHYVGPEGRAAGLALNADEVVTLFEPALAEMIMIDRLEADRVGEPPRLNGDPFVGSQDWIIAGYAVAMMSASDGDDEVRILARLDFDTPYPSEAVQIQLVWMDEAWRIAEIEWDATSLRDILTSD